MHRGVGAGEVNKSTNHPTAPCACGCGEIRRVYDRDGKPHRFVHGHNAKLYKRLDAEKKKEPK